MLHSSTRANEFAATTTRSPPARNTVHLSLKPKDLHARGWDLSRHITSAADWVLALLSLDPAFDLTGAPRPDVLLENLREHGFVQVAPPLRGEGPRIAAEFDAPRALCV